LKPLVDTKLIYQFFLGETVNGKLHAGPFEEDVIGVLELKSQIPLFTVKLFKRFGEPPKGLDGKGGWRCAY
tara:strand:+ start:51 stop:263 length:213 start_codon:yes stop_codon:yes gene_type:complete